MQAGKHAALLGWLALLAHAGVTAAPADEMRLAPSAAVQCLTLGPADQPLAYPKLSLERKDGSSVEVELTFSAPDAAPRVKIENESSVFDGLAEAVRDHVRRFRVPCMAAAGAPVVIRQTYVFTPNDGRKVAASTPVDPADEARRRKLGCITHIKGEKRPDYPAEARRREDQGNVYVHLRFTRPDQPPEVTEVAAVQSRPLRNEVDWHLAGLRMPCLDGEPIETDMLFRFELDGGPRQLLPDMGLLRLLASAQSVKRGVYFDLKTMGCPFDLRLTYLQPHAPNGVAELETSHPARRPFLDWLGSVTLKLPEKINTNVLGQTITVAVPCTTIDL